MAFCCSAGDIVSNSSMGVFSRGMGDCPVREPSPPDVRGGGVALCTRLCADSLGGNARLTARAASAHDRPRRPMKLSRWAQLQRFSRRARSPFALAYPYPPGHAQLALFGAPVELTPVGLRCARGF